ncbi:MAG: DMT family transporter [Alphaproteobacteria bacterium]
MDDAKSDTILSSTHPSTPPPPLHFAPAAARLDAVSWISLLVLVAIWGSTYAVLRIGVRTIDPVWLVAGRLTGGALSMVVLMAVAQLFRRSGATSAYEPVGLVAIGWFSLVGVAFTAIPFVFYATAAKTTASALLAICNGGTPIFTALVAHVVTRDDRLTPRRAAGVTIGFVGLFVLVAPEILNGVTANAAGLAYAIIGALLYAGSGICTRLAPRISPLASTLVILTSGAIVALTCAALTTPFPVAPSIESLAAMVVLALVPTAFAYVLWVWLVQKAGAVFGSLTNYLMPLWAAGLGVVFLGENVSWPAFAAMALIVGGVAVASRRPRGAAQKFN